MQTRGLQSDSLGQARMAVTQHADGNPSGHVQEATPIGVPQDAAFPRLITTGARL